MENDNNNNILSGHGVNGSQLAMLFKLYFTKDELKRFLLSKTTVNSQKILDIIC